MVIKNTFSLTRILPLVFALNIANVVHAQCPAISCPGNITQSNDPNSCGAIVNFVAPVGTNPCGAQTFNYTGSMQNYTVPANVTTLTITAKGAQGGNGGGLGAIMTGDVTVTPGNTLKILVGGQGMTNYQFCGTWFGAGGGGGSFVTTSTNTPLIIAGGGGGNICAPLVGMDAVTGTTGQNGNSPAYPSNIGYGGVAGNGATGNLPHGGNGGGLLTDGANGSCASPGQAFVNGGAGGVACIGLPGSDGGYGGGGGGGNAGGGGGGGYSGGGASYHFPGNGGGGGSYNSGTNQVNSVGNTGNGQVIIAGGSATTTLIAGLPPGSVFPIGTTTETYQCADGLGNFATCSFTVTVIDTSHPHITGPADQTACLNVVNGLAPTVTNASCPVITYTLTGATTGSGVNDASGTYFNAGATTVTYTVTSANGNTDSYSFNVYVSDGAPPTIVISSNLSGDSACNGIPVVFTSTITNGGPGPVFQWIKNNVIVGSGPTYTDATLATNDIVYCVLTSNDPCVAITVDTSNSISMTVNPVVVPTVTVTPNPGNPVCPGTAVSFTATVTDAGPNPTYQWHKNNVNVGTNSPTFIIGSVVTGDVFDVTFTSDAICAIPATQTSTPVTMSTDYDSPFLSGVAGQTITKTPYLLYVRNTIRDANCDLIATIEPQGLNPVYGGAKVSVTLDNNVMTYNGQPYLQRHFDIEPDSFAATATAICTLYAYQSEFDAYNLVAAQYGVPQMPYNYIYDGSIRVTQFHGTGTAPGNYTGNSEEVVNPAVYWDTAHNWWQISFAVKGFSGFYIHTNQFPLTVGTHAKTDFSINAFPNPVQDKVTIQINGKRGNNSMLSITDLLGKEIVTVPVNDDKAIADISSLAQGMYLIKYTDDERSQTIKVTKQ